MMFQGSGWSVNASRAWVKAGDEEGAELERMESCVKCTI